MRAGHAKLKAILDGVRGREDLLARRHSDPVAFVHRYESSDDREIVALIAAACAFGNVTAIRMKLEELFERIREIDTSPARAADDPAAVKRVMRGWKHRLFRGEDLAALMIGARHVQRETGTLGRAFAAELARTDSLRPATTSLRLATLSLSASFREALACFLERIRRAGGLPMPGERPPDGRRGPAHLLPDARAGSAAKRIFLFLRWMIRPADGIDLGLWSHDIPPSRLLMPLDVHIHKLARNVGLTRRQDLSWKTAAEVTAKLALLDAADPTRYDFSLCHLGMVQRCPSRKDPAPGGRCEGCGVKPVCIHWPRDKARRSVRR